MADVSTTRRKSMSPTRRLRIWEAHRGVCVLCKLPIDGAREPWIIEHLRALALGGEDTDANCAPAHFHCAEAKTHDQDMPAIVKAKRQKLKALGIRKPSSLTHPTLKRLMDGRVVDRRTGQEISR